MRAASTRLRAGAACMAIAAICVLTGCAGDTETTSPASPSPSSTLAAVPSVTVVPDETPSASAASLPTDCAQVGSSATRAATIDQLTLQGDGTDTVRPAPPGAELVLGCDWFAGDATGYLLLLSTTEVATADATIATLPDEGWTCGVAADGEGDICTRVTPHTQYPVDTVETVIGRDGIWIYQSATNVDGQALLSDLQTSIWMS